MGESVRPLILDIIDILLEGPTCLICVSQKCGVTQLDTVRAIERIGTTLLLRSDPGARCRTCGSALGPIYWIGARGK